MSAARRFEPRRFTGPTGRVGSTGPSRSTVDPEADMLAAALLERGRGGMSVQREFADGEVVPGTRYRVVGLIGSGGMGSVYEVEHEELGKRFVLKALLRSLTNREDLVHRLRNEWRALGRLEHPNIVSVTDAGLTTTGVPFYVMERLQGETLSARLRRDRRLPPPDALGFAAEVLEGLSAAHRINIVHRDVKPPNIFLVGGKIAKLLDFGIAKLLDPKASQITGRGIAIGTPRYMAPEQATGGAVDARTDLYATGLILFEMLAGTGPFGAARDANELFFAHLAKEVPPVSKAAPGIPAELDRLMARLLAKKPEDRPADAASVAAELRVLRERLSGPHRAVVAPAGPDDRTNPGGPFDTLEAAQTIPSERPDASRSRRPLNEATTRTGIGPRDGETDAQSGKTLRLDALEVDDRPELPTRTAAPLPVPSHAPLETPPPVEPAQSLAKPDAPGSAGRRSYLAVVVALGMAAAVVAVVAVRLRATSLEAPSGARAGAASPAQPQREPALQAAEFAIPTSGIPPENAPPLAVSLSAAAAPPALPAAPIAPMVAAAGHRNTDAEGAAPISPGVVVSPVPAVARAERSGAAVSAAVVPRAPAKAAQPAALAAAPAPGGSAVPNAIKRSSTAPHPSAPLPKAPTPPADPAPLPGSGL